MIRSSLIIGLILASAIIVAGLAQCAHACEKPYHKPTWCELHRCV